MFSSILLPLCCVITAVVVLYTDDGILGNIPRHCILHAVTVIETAIFKVRNIIMSKNFKLLCINFILYGCIYTYMCVHMCVYVCVCVCLCVLCMYVYVYA